MAAGVATLAKRRPAAWRPGACRAEPNNAVDLVHGLDNGKLNRREFCETVALAAAIYGAGEAAQAQVYASEQAQRGVVLTVVTGVAISYVNLRALDRQLEIAQSTAANFGETVRIFTGGIMPAGSDSVVMQERATEIAILST